MVMTSGTRGRTRGKIQVGAASPSLTAAGGMSLSPNCAEFGLTEALDEAMGPVESAGAGSPAVRC